MQCKYKCKYKSKSTVRPSAVRSFIDNTVVYYLWFVHRPSALLFCLPPQVAVTPVAMDLLERTGVRSEQSREDMTASLAALCSEEQLKTLREALFEEAKNTGLAHPKDIIVKRLNHACGPLLKRKLSQDVPQLVYVLKTQQSVPRVKNGKRAISAFTQTFSDTPAFVAVAIGAFTADTPQSCWTHRLTAICCGNMHLPLKQLAPSIGPPPRPMRHVLLSPPCHQTTKV